MSVSLSNSKDITANRINIIQPNGTALDLMSDIITSIEGGLTEDQLQTLSDISTTINNDPNLRLPRFRIKSTTHNILSITIYRARLLICIYTITTT